MESSVNRSTFAAKVSLLALTLLLLVSAATATAIERDPSYEDGPRTPFNFLGGVDEDTADVPGLPATAERDGLAVVGDSISIAVPYVRRAAEDGIRVRVQAWSGWTIRLHRLVTGWQSSTQPSLETAATGDAAAVFVSLGTNDVGCLEPYGLCPDTPEPGTPEYESFGREERARIVEEVDGAAERLLQAGKCVLWAGPRPRNSGYSPDADVEAFNDRLRDIAAEHPGRFTYVDYAAYSESDPALRADFDDPESDGIHPRTAAGRAAIAELAITSAREHCPIRSEPRVAVSPPLPPPPAPPTPPAPEPPAPEPLPGPPLLLPRVIVEPSPPPRVASCSARSTSALRLSCRRALAVAACSRFRSTRDRSPCMQRVRRLYGASTGEKRALRRCAKKPRARRASCRATAVRSHRFR